MTFVHPLQTQTSGNNNNNNKESGGGGGGLAGDFHLFKVSRLTGLWRQILPPHKTHHTRRFMTVQSHPFL